MKETNSELKYKSIKMIQTGVGWWRKVQKETFGNKTFHILIVVTVTWMYLLGQSHQIVHFKWCILFYVSYALIIL